MDVQVFYKQHSRSSLFYEVALGNSTLSFSHQLFHKCSISLSLLRRLSKLHKATHHEVRTITSLSKRPKDKAPYVLHKRQLMATTDINANMLILILSGTISDEDSFKDA